VLFQSDIDFPNATDSPSFLTHDHSEGGMAAIPNAGLTNSSVTISGGNNLTSTNSTINLGNSATINMDANWTSAVGPSDNTDFQFGNGDDFLMRFDSGNTRFEMSDGATDVIRIPVGGSVTLPNRNLDMGTNSITNVASVDNTNLDNVSEGEKVTLASGMVQWADGLSNEEVDRIVLQTDETFVVERIEFRQKGGGTSASASVRVQDTTAASTVGSQTLGGTTKDPGSSGSANTVQVQLTNGTGGTINASYKIVGRITGA
jgi:hypothetical protein